MNKRMLRLNPDQLNYQDRGKMKWQGLLLSDHSEALKKIKQQQKNVIPQKSKLSLIDITQQLALAYHNQQPVLVQTNTLTLEQHLQSFTGLVSGNDGGDIYFTLKNGRVIQIALENIRWLQTVDSLVWQIVE